MRWRICCWTDVFLGTPFGIWLFFLNPPWGDRNILPYSIYLSNAESLDHIYDRAYCRGSHLYGSTGRAAHCSTHPRRRGATQGLASHGCSSIFGSQTDLSCSFGVVSRMGRIAYRFYPTDSGDYHWIGVTVY